MPFKTKQKIKEHNAYYYSTHVEKCKKLNKEYYMNNIESERNRSLKYAKEHKESVQKYNNNYVKMRSKIDTSYATLRKLRSRLQGAFKQHLLHKKMRANEYGIDYNATIKHLGNKPNDGKKYEIDHIVPLSSFDFNNLEEIKIAFAPQNHQWLEASENRRKHNKHLFYLDIKDDILSAH